MVTKKLQLVESLFPPNPQAGQVLSIDENGNMVWAQPSEAETIDYNWLTITYGSYMKYDVSDYYTAEGLGTTNTLDCELASTLTSANNSNYSSLMFFTVSVFNMLNGTITDENVAKYLQRLVAEYEVMKNGGALGGTVIYLAIKNTNDDAPRYKVLLSPATYSTSDYTHIFQVMLSDNSLSDAAYWNNDTQTLYLNNIKRDYIDTTLTTKNLYADAKAVGDRLTDLQDILDSKMDSSEMTSELAGKSDVDHSHEISDVTDLQTKLDDLTDKAIQPDWSQNDETSPDYVKNRTHYTKITEETVLDCTASYAGGDSLGSSYMFDQSAELVPGERYELYINGELYAEGDCDDSGIVYANLNSSNDIVYFIGSEIFGSGMLPGIVPDEFAVEITHAIEEIHQLDKKFIPDHIHDDRYTTSGDGATYTATVDGITELTAGVSFIMIPHTVSTSTTPKLNVNDLGEKYIRRRLSTSSSTTVAGYSTNWLGANKPMRVVYDGTHWIVDLVRPSASDIYGTVPISSGGTEATTAESARANLGAMADVPVTASDAGKFLRVSSDGVWIAEEIPNAEEETF